MLSRLGSTCVDDDELIAGDGATMEIWEAMDFGGGLGEVELLYPAKKLGAN